MTSEDSNQVVGETKRFDDEKTTNRKLSGRILEVRDKKGLFQAAIPYLNSGIAWFLLFLNVFLPGTGTLLMGFAALCGAKTCSKKPNKCLDFLINILCGTLQLISAVVIVGWIWSIYWGMYVVTMSHERSRKSSKGGDKEAPIYTPQNPPKE